jgi:serine/threonine-protein kinase
MQTAAELAIVFREPGEKRSTVPINPPVQSIYKPNRRKVGYLAALAVIFLVTSLNIGKPLGGSPAPLPVMKHLAVLPFVAVDPDTNARAFSQGLSEALTAKLTQLTTKHPLQVVPASEIRAQSISSVEQAHTILGVNLVFEGSFRLSGPLIRVTYDLVDARSRRVLRADAITADANDPFLLEDQVVDSALRSLDLELTWQERHRIASRGTTEPAAYDLYLRGRGYLLDYQDPENTKKAIAAFTEALQRDPQYAPAFAGLGEGYWQKFEQTHDSTWVQQAEEACRHANASSVGHGCLGTVFNGTGSYEQAAQEFERELKIDPTSDSAYRGLAYAYEKLGKADDAERTYLSAIKARPRYWAGYSWLGVFLVDQGRYAESLEMFAKVNELAPDNIRGYNNRGGIYVLTGRFAEAETVLKKSLNIRPTADAYLNLGTADFYLHKFEDAASAYEQALKLDSQNRTAWGNLADAYYWIPAKRKDALDAYRKATTLGEEQVRVNPNNAVLRSYLAVYYAMLNERRSANMHLAKALASHDHAPDIFLNSAIIYNQFGNSADAILSLKKGLQLGLLPVVASNHPSLDNLKSDPAVKALFDTSKVQ